MRSTVGSRELKNRLGTYLRYVREGGTVLVTDRGRPVAELRPIDVESTSPEDRLKVLAMEGWIQAPTTSRPFHFEPVTLPGKPITETLQEDREDRF